MEVAERGDLNVCSMLTCPRILRKLRNIHTQAENDKNETRLFIVAPLVLAYMINDQLCVLCFLASLNFYLPENMFIIAPWRVTH